MFFTAIRDVWNAFKLYNEQAIVWAAGAMAVYITIAAAKFIASIIRGKRVQSIWHVLFKTCAFGVFGLYCSYVVALTISGREAFKINSSIYLDPFAFDITNKVRVLESLENFVMFIPFGCLAPMVWKYFRGIIRTSSLSFLACVIIELTQLCTGRGYFDVDDIILNTLGGVCGYLLFAGLYDGYMGVKRRLITDVARRCKMEAPLGKLYERLTLRNGLLLFGVQMVPVIIWYNIIMGFSSDVGEKSGYMSAFLLSLLCKMSGRGDVSVSVIRQSDDLMYYENILRKCAHMFEYAVLAILIWAIVYSIRRIWVMLSYTAGIALAAIVGYIDEMNQTIIEGRNGTAFDLIYDCGGAVIAMFMVALTVRLVSIHYRNKYRS